MILQRSQKAKLLHVFFLFLIFCVRLSIQASLSCDFLSFRGGFHKDLGSSADVPGPAEGPKWFRVYLDPKEPTFLGFLIMISLYKPLNR